MTTTADASTHARINNKAFIDKTRMAFRDADEFTNHGLSYTIAGDACDTPSMTATYAMGDPHVHAWRHPR